jgi:hypothetical protein
MEPALAHRTPLWQIQTSPGEIVLTEPTSTATTCMAVVDASGVREWGGVLDTEVFSDHLGRLATQPSRPSNWSGSYSTSSQTPQPDPQSRWSARSFRTSGSSIVFRRRTGSTHRELSPAAVDLVHHVHAPSAPASSYDCGRISIVNFRRSDGRTVLT